jgi:hypothetical protein
LRHRWLAQKPGRACRWLGRQIKQLTKSEGFRVFGRYRRAKPIKSTDFLMPAQDLYVFIADLA